jgi:hypothetical protein
MSSSEKYIREGHPGIEELIAEQGLCFRAIHATSSATSGQTKKPSTISSVPCANGEGTLRLTPRDDARRPRYGRRLVSFQERQPST